MCWCCRRCWVSLTQAKVQGLSQGRLTSRGLGPLGGTSEVQSKRGNATVFESSKANAVGTPLAKPTQREELRWKNKQRTYGKPSTKTSLGGDGSTCLGGCQPATPTYVGSPPDDEQSRPPQHHPVSSCKKMLNSKRDDVAPRPSKLGAAHTSGRNPWSPGIGAGGREIPREGK